MWAIAGMRTLVVELICTSIARGPVRALHVLVDDKHNTPAPAVGALGPTQSVASFSIKADTGEGA